MLLLSTSPESGAKVLIRPNWTYQPNVAMQQSQAAWDLLLPLCYPAPHYSGARHAIGYISKLKRFQPSASWRLARAFDRLRAKRLRRAFVENLSNQAYSIHPVSDSLQPHFWSFTNSPPGCNKPRKAWYQLDQPRSGHGQFKSTSTEWTYPKIKTVWMEIHTFSHISDLIAGTQRCVYERISISIAELRS